MELSTTENKLSISTDVIKTSFNIELTKNKFQQLQNEINSIEFTEDNIPVISEKLKHLNSLYAVIDNSHKKGKAQYWDVCKKYDSVKADFYKVLDLIINPFRKKYEDLCKIVEGKQKAADAEKQRIANIKEGIKSNILSFSQSIASATTTEDLISIERRINLEKSRKEKYQEFLPDAVIEFDNLLNTPLKNQKIKIKELEELKLKEAELLKVGDDEELLNVIEKKELLEATIEENKETVQHNAINFATSSNDIVVAEEILPDIKIRRKEWKVDEESIDFNKLIKKHPDWIVMSLDMNKVKEFIKANKENWDEEHIEHGVRFYLNKKY